MLSSLRDSSGGPRLRVKLLALLVALLLGGPLTVAVLQGAGAVLRAAFAAPLVVLPGAAGAPASPVAP